MKLSYIALFFILLVAYSPASSLGISDGIKTTVKNTAIKAFSKAGFNFAKSSNDINPHSAGLKCWVCTLMVAATEQYTVLHNKNIDTFITKEFCSLFPSEAAGICSELIETFGPTIITALINSHSADDICRSIGICTNPQCNLMKGKDIRVTLSPDWARNIQLASLGGRSLATQEFHDNFLSIGSFFSKIGQRVGKIFHATESKGADLIHKFIEKLLTNHTSPFDMDGDGFSEINGEMRGYNWRGRDCNDLDVKIRPGRKTDPYPGRAIDYNCNGIHGIDPKTKKPYKEVLCANTKQYGVVVMGDSAGAMADIPPTWPNASAWGNNTFKSILNSVLNEVDLPHMSGYTGYVDQSPYGPVRSVYKHLYERNKCNFRDYQNIAVNGAWSGSALENIKRLSRDQKEDHPLLMFLELVGNDVCNYMHNYSNMTKPEDFKKNIIKILDYLDTVVPAGSHLVVLGLVNGSLIFEGVKGKTHPIGVSYEHFYDFFSCTQASFCWGWLNTDASVRDKTTELAMKLNAVYAEILPKYKAKNYDIVYYDFPAQTIFDQWKAEGKDPYHLLNPVDGFHPNPNFHARLGDYLWNSLMRDHPEWFGDVNPNNDLITKLFGNQGGY